MSSSIVDEYGRSHVSRTPYGTVVYRGNIIVVPYGTGSLLSCDSSGNYFNLWLNGYQPERYYTLRFRVVSGSGTDDETDQYFEEGFTFKVTL